MSGRKIGLLILILGFGAALETAWGVRQHTSIGPHGCRVIGGQFYGPSFSFETGAHRRLAPGAPVWLEIENAFGGVRVSAGEPGAVEVTLRKVVFQPTAERARSFADRIELRMEEDGDRLRIRTNRDELSRREDVGFETHLDLRVPPDAMASLRNEHGRVEAVGLARAEVRASFGDVVVERITGPVTVEARHGAVHVRDLRATLTLSARHGDVELSGVKGRAVLDVGHGGVTAEHVGGLELKLVHGNLEAETVDGDLVVRAQHAAVRASDVTGRVKVVTSYDDVRLARVGGDASVKVEHGSITAEDIKGALVAETSFADAELARIDGQVEVTVRHGGVVARGLSAGVRAHASGDDVTIDGFDGPAEVTVERGSVRLAPQRPLVSEVTARATGGDVHLAVESGSRFDLEAEAKRGEVRVDVPGLEITRAGPRRPSRVTGRMGAGGSRVQLSADGDVEIETRPATGVSGQP